jgi:hypothetical protein
MTPSSTAGPVAGTELPDGPSGFVIWIAIGSLEEEQEATTMSETTSIERSFRI